MKSLMLAVIAGTAIWAAGGANSISQMTWWQIGAFIIGGAILGWVSADADSWLRAQARRPDRPVD